MSSKPDKPYPDFPLTAHANGQWCKRVRRVLRYFGPWADPDGALARWERERDYWLTGRTPPPTGDAADVGRLVNAFLDGKDAARQAGRLSERSFRDYKQTGLRLARVLGKATPLAVLGPQDFRLLLADIASTRGVVGQVGEITRCRMFIKFAHDFELVERPINMGPEFVIPSKREVRLVLAQRTHPTFTAAEIGRLLGAAAADQKAMILLAINVAYGNSDIGNLIWGALDLAGGWATFPRPKTGVPRRAKLWPETIAAVRAYKKVRRAPHAARDELVVFVTRKGNRWAKAGTAAPLAREFAKLARAAKVPLAGRGFYDLRHTFATEASQACDQEAVNTVMGHAPRGHDVIPGLYRHRVDDARLERVAAHVRRWLFGGISSSTKPRRRTRQGCSPSHLKQAAQRTASPREK